MATVLMFQQSEKFYFPGRASDMTTLGMGFLVLLTLVFAVVLCYVAWNTRGGDPPVGR
jgi:hypothetical protein